MVDRLWQTAAACALAALVGGCTPKEAPAPAATYTLRRVALPDLSHASRSVQDQLRQGYALLTKQIDAPKASPAALGAAYGRFGMLLMAAEFRDDAEAAFLDAQTLNPREARWPYYLGHLYKIKGDAPRSAAAFERALALQPDDVPTLVWLGDANLDQGKPDAAEPLFARALALQPTSTAAQFGLGRVALARQDYARAVGSLERALALDPQATVIHYPLAMAYRGVGDQAKAAAHLAQRGTLAITPADPRMDELDALLNSALNYEVGGAEALDKGDWKTAAENFRKGIELAPKEPSLHHKLGTALALMGDGRGAVEQFEAAIKLQPTFSKAQYSLGVILASTGHPQQAIEHLSAAVKAEPGYVEARLQLAHTLRRTGQLEASLPQYAQIVKADARMPEARFGYAAALIRLRRYADARDYLAAAMTQYPDEPAFANAAARLLAAAPDDRVRDGRRAAAIMQVLTTRGLRTVDALETMAMAQAEVGQYSEAVTWQRQAIAAASRAGDHAIAQIISDNLRLYEAHKPCRTPWRADEPIEFQKSGPQAAPEAPRT